MNIFIDIETLPGSNRPDPSDISAPGNYKDPVKIAAYQESKVEEAYRGQSLDSMAGRILCIGYAVNNEPTSIIAPQDPFDPASEVGLLMCLANLLPDKLSMESVTWIGHNAAGFDMKWIWRRAIRYNLSRLVSSIRMDKYRGNVADTMRMWAQGEYRDNCKLDTLAEFLGVERKTEGMDGSRVYPYHLAGRHQEIYDYCRQDVEVVRAVYNRLRMAA